MDDVIFVITAACGSSTVLSQGDMLLTTIKATLNFPLPLLWRFLDLFLETLSEYAP